MYCIDKTLKLQYVTVVLIYEIDIQIRRRRHQRRGHARSRKYLPTLHLHLQICCDTALHVRALTRRTNIEFTSGKIRVQIPGTYPRSCTYTPVYVHDIVPSVARRL